MLKNTDIDYLRKVALDVRKRVLSMIVSAHASHIASAYSAVEILVFLYEKVLFLNKSKPNDPTRDRFILSKGWGVSALYVLLARKGFFPEKLLDTYCTDGSKFIGIATRNQVPGIEATTGSMGHGLPIGVGMALAGKLQRRPFRVFVVISDGECDEGSTWESILQAGQYKLDNLTVIVDYNKWQSFGRVRDILGLEPFKDKWESFNWSVMQIDGHDFSQIEKAFAKVPKVLNKPTVIIANTIKGKGVSVLENRNEWHYKTPTDKEIRVAERELRNL